MLRARRRAVISCTVAATTTRDEGDEQRADTGVHGELELGTSSRTGEMTTPATPSAASTIPRRSRCDARVITGKNTSVVYAEPGPPVPVRRNATASSWIIGRMSCRPSGHRAHGRYACRHQLADGEQRGDHHVGPARDLDAGDQQREQRDQEHPDERQLALDHAAVRARGAGRGDAGSASPS